MKTAVVRPAHHEATLARIARGLRMLTVPLPHLSGLAAAVRVDIDERVPTMGVFASGRLVANRGSRPGCPRTISSSCWRTNCSTWPFAP